MSVRARLFEPTVTPRFTRALLQAAARRDITVPEALVAELEHFVGVIRGDHECEVDGRQALSALELVWGVQRSLQNELE